MSLLDGDVPESVAVVKRRKLVRGLWLLLAVLISYLVLYRDPTVVDIAIPDTNASEPVHLSSTTRLAVAAVHFQQSECFDPFAEAQQQGPFFALLLPQLRAHVASTSTGGQDLLQLLKASAIRPQADTQRCPGLSDGDLYSKPNPALAKALLLDQSDALLVVDTFDLEMPAQHGMTYVSANATTYLSVVLFNAEGRRIWSGQNEFGGTLKHPYNPAELFYTSKPNPEAARTAAAKWLVKQLVR